MRRVQGKHSRAAHGGNANTGVNPTAITITNTNAGADTGAVDCTARLVAVATSSDTTCPAGAPQHWYPVGGEPTDCHGWAAKDTSGREHLNSASNLKCNADGSFTLTQYAGNLGCTGTGVEKTFRQARCEQDPLPVLWSRAAYLSCCSAPGSAACAANTGTPSVARQGSAIYLNGRVCKAATTPSAPTSSPQQPQQPDGGNSRGEAAPSTDSTPAAAQCNGKLATADAKVAALHQQVLELKEAVARLSKCSATRGRRTLV